MKTENGLALLARQNALTENDWHELVELRLKMLKPYLRDMSLETIGDLNIVNDYFKSHAIIDDTPEVEGDSKFNLDTRAIFPTHDNFSAHGLSANREYTGHDESGYATIVTEKFWGITRNCEWITIEVYITRGQIPYHSGRTREMAVAERVTIKESSLLDVCIFSKRNLEYMRRFASIYSNLEFAKQPVSQLPWGHIVRLMQMIKNNSERDWYVQQTIKNGWSRSTLEIQIETGLYERQGIIANKTTNYHEHLSAAQSDLARDLLKDPYNFDFLTLSEKAHERDIENALVTHARDFLIELGQGFAFVGSQVPLTIDDQEFFIDLLFYHLHLRCFVVIELKANNFKPEHTGQLGFYLAAVDDFMKKESDNPTIGILLCRSKSKIVAEYERILNKK